MQWIPLKAYSSLPNQATKPFQWCKRVGHIFTGLITALICSYYSAGLLSVLVCDVGFASSESLNSPGALPSQFGTGDVWDLSANIPLNWKGTPCSTSIGDDAGSRASLDCYSHPPDGFESVYVVSVNRHGARAHSEPAIVPEFQGVPPGQLTPQGFHELRTAGEEMRAYFNRFMNADDRQPETRFQRLQQSIRSRQESWQRIFFESLPPKDQQVQAAQNPKGERTLNATLDVAPGDHVVFVRSSCYPRAVLSGRAWLEGFFNINTPQARVLELLGEYAGDCLDQDSVEKVVPGSMLETAYSRQCDPLLFGMLDRHTPQWIWELVSRLRNEPLMTHLEALQSERLKVLKGKVKESLLDIMACQLGDMAICEEAAGVSQPLEAYLRANYKGACDKEKKQGQVDALSDRPVKNAPGKDCGKSISSLPLKDIVSASKEGFQLAMYLAFTYPPIMRTAATPLLDLIANLLQAKVTGSREDIACAANSLKFVGGFNSLLGHDKGTFRGNHYQGHGQCNLCPPDSASETEVDSVQAFLQNSSILLFSWHDYVIISLLGLIGIRSNQLVPFGASVQLELLRRRITQNAGSLSDVSLLPAESMDQSSSEASKNGMSKDMYFVRLHYGTPGYAKRVLPLPFCGATRKTAETARASQSGEFPHRFQAELSDMCPLPAFLSLVRTLGGSTQVEKLVCRQTQ